MNMVIHTELMKERKFSVEFCLDYDRPAEISSGHSGGKSFLGLWVVHQWNRWSQNLHRTAACQATDGRVCRRFFLTKATDVNKQLRASRLRESWRSAESAVEPQDRSAAPESAHSSGANPNQCPLKKHRTISMNSSDQLLWAYGKSTT